MAKLIGGLADGKEIETLPEWEVVTIKWVDYAFDFTLNGTSVYMPKLPIILIYKKINTDTFEVFDGELQEEES